jgi:hypothetical protein
MGLVPQEELGYTILEIETVDSEYLERESRHLRD